LFEVKSNFDEWGKARIQLNKAEKSLKYLLQIIGLKNVPIKKVIAVPKTASVSSVKVKGTINQMNKLQEKEEFGKILLMFFNDAESGLIGQKNPHEENQSNLDQIELLILVDVKRDEKLIDNFFPRKGTFK